MLQMRPGGPYCTWFDTTTCTLLMNDSLGTALKILAAEVEEVEADTVPDLSATVVVKLVTLPVLALTM